MEKCRIFPTIRSNLDKQYLLWAFCWGEHADCCLFKAIIAGDPLSEELMPTDEIASVARRQQQRGIE